MEELLIRLSSLPGVTGSFYVGDDSSFISQSLSSSFVQENAKRAVMVLAQTFEALSQVAQFKINRMLVNTGGSRLFIRRSDKGFLNLLTDITADVSVIDSALDGALKEMLIMAQPPAPAPAQAPPTVPQTVVAAASAKTAPTSQIAPAPAPATTPAAVAPAAPTQIPAPKPPATVEASVLEKILAQAEEALGELGATIYENQLSDHKLNTSKLTRDSVMKFCYALQKDASMIIGPSAAKQMADKMMMLLK
jgi:predicted regulator of Ras-like GTPase activity (Roadblock/LC7/MglB family)